MEVAHHLTTTGGIDMQHYHELLRSKICIFYLVYENMHEFEHYRGTCRKTKFCDSFVLETNLKNKYLKKSLFARL